MAHSEIRLSVAEERTIYDVAAIDRAMEEAAGNRNEALATLYDAGLLKCCNRQVNGCQRQSPECRF